MKKIILSSIAPLIVCLIISSIAGAATEQVETVGESAVSLADALPATTELTDTQRGQLGRLYGGKGKLLHENRNRSWNVDRPAETALAAFDRAIAYDEGPCVVVAEVVKEDNVFPMIPAGAPLDHMIIEAPKERLEKPSGST